MQLVFSFEDSRVCAGSCGLRVPRDHVKGRRFRSLLALFLPPTSTLRWPKPAMAANSPLKNQGLTSGRIEQFISRFGSGRSHPDSESRENRHQLAGFADEPTFPIDAIWVRRCTQVPPAQPQVPPPKACRAASSRATSARVPLVSVPVG